MEKNKQNELKCKENLNKNGKLKSVCKLSKKMKQGAL